MSDSGNGSTSDEFTVLLEGGRPWGFTLHGGADFRSPLKIGKVVNKIRANVWFGAISTLEFLMFHTI